MSVVLRPEGKLSDSLFLTTSAAVAVYRAVEKICGISLEIKWVNDLYFQGKKVGGILTEAVTDFESGDIEFAVVGIGLNLYVEKETLPEGLVGIAGGNLLRKGRGQGSGQKSSDRRNCKLSHGRGRKE